MEALNEKTAEYLVGLGAAQVEIRTVHGTPVVIVPDDYAVHELPHLRPSPQHANTTFVAQTKEAFIGYLERFVADSDVPTCMVFCNELEGQFVAILDYHQIDGPYGWCRHHAVYTCPPAREYSAWMANDGKKMAQEDFAYFLERNAVNVVEPDSATMVEVAMTLQASVKKSFKSGIRLSDGSFDFVHVEDVEATAGNTGHITVPDSFTLGLRIFHGAAPYQIEAKLRFRLDSGRLVFWYDLINIQAAREDAMASLVLEIKADIDALDKGIGVLSGVAPGMR